MSSTTKFPLPLMGVDVLSEETALRSGTVRVAKNVNISREGVFSRRAGFQEHPLSRPGMHSLYYSPQRGYLLVACNEILYRVEGENLVELDTLNSPDSVDYTEHNGNLYYTNKTSIGYIPADSKYPEPVGVIKPSAPILSDGNGGLEAGGKYGVCITLVNKRGEESPASDVVFIYLRTGGITMGGLPVYPLSEGISIRAYVTSKDGDILRQAEEFPAIFPTYTVSMESEGQICDSQFLEPLPPGAFIRWYNSRLYTAINGTLYYSEAMRPRLYNPAHNFIEFSGYISFIEPVVDGIYVGDSRGVWFLSGPDPENFQLISMTKTRAVTKSSICVHPEHFDPEVVRTQVPAAVWLSTSGYVVGLPGGNLIELNADRVKVDSRMSGRSAFLFQEGMRQVITLVNSNNPTSANIAVNSDI